jgi:hypothetical protein
LRLSHALKETPFESVLDELMAIQMQPIDMKRPSFRATNQRRVGEFGNMRSYVIP